MKRIIEGATYNTDTATAVAEGVHEDGSRGVVTTSTLYQNRAGVFFEVEEVETSYRDRDANPAIRTSYEWTVVGDAAGALERCERYGYTILREIADMPPEAVAGEKLATIYVRVPPALRAAIDARASKAGASVNTFASRCLEGCVDDIDEVMSVRRLTGRNGLTVHGDNLAFALGVAVQALSQDDRWGEQRKALDSVLDRIAGAAAPTFRSMGEAVRVGRAGTMEPTEDGYFVRRFSPVEVITR